MDGISNTWFKLFACCMVVKGSSCSIIYDLERSAFYDLPNDFLELLGMAKEMDVASIKKAYNNEQDPLIDAFFNRFVEKEIGFYTEDPASFPDIDFTWESPNFITNSIIELEGMEEFDFENVVSQLSSLACKAVQIRILAPLPNTESERIVRAFKGTRISHIELLIPYTPSTSNEDIYTLIALQPRVRRIMVYAASEEKVIAHENELFDKKIIYFKKDIRTTHGEEIRIGRFMPNDLVFSEGLTYNSGLNRKVCIDRKGELKNYFSHKDSFGNVRMDKIRDVIEKSEFQEKWFLSNDKIEICKDCQYRYACISNTDIKKEGDKYYKIDMCSFDPYANSWAADRRCQS